jgi:hypothetical protein
MEWELWQINRKLPNTEPYSSHYGINLGCYRCGALVILDNEIAMVKNGSVWTKTNIQFVNVVKENPKFDAKLNKHYYDLRCEGCQQNVGVYYFDNHTNKQQGSQTGDFPLSFPAAKIFYLRRTSNGQLFHKTLLLGEQHLVEDSLVSLTISQKSPEHQEKSNSPTQSV